MSKQKSNKIMLSEKSSSQEQSKFKIIIEQKQSRVKITKKYLNDKIEVVNLQGEIYTLKDSDNIESLEKNELTSFSDDQPKHLFENVFDGTVFDSFSKKKNKLDKTFQSFLEFQELWKNKNLFPEQIKKTFKNERPTRSPIKVEKENSSLKEKKQQHLNDINNQASKMMNLKSKKIQKNCKTKIAGSQITQVLTHPSKLNGKQNGKVHNDQQQTMINYLEGYSQKHNLNTSLQDNKNHTSQDSNQKISSTQQQKKVSCQATRKNNSQSKSVEVFRIPAPTLEHLLERIYFKNATYDQIKQYLDDAFDPIDSIKLLFEKIFLKMKNYAEVLFFNLIYQLQRKVKIV